MGAGDFTGNDPPRLYAVVPAAGGGVRFGGGRPKQYADLAGRPLVAWTLDRLTAALPLAGVLVAIAPDDELYRSLIGTRSGVETLRCGGATRAATVAGALAILASRCADDDWVLVHDAARPCVPASALQRLVGEVGEDATGGLLAVPLADTLKREDAGTPSRVLRTESRAGLWQAQTPQMFRLGVLAEAVARSGKGASDEAAAIEATGLSPKLVACSAENFKVTFAADFATAAALLQARAR
jgi:2-C-methyl-D-erythritol 4-phosphate cytidylyltransferase